MVVGGFRSFHVLVTTSEIYLSRVKVSFVGYRYDFCHIRRIELSPGDYNNEAIFIILR